MHPEQSTPRRSILIVDDELALLDAMERAFLSAGEGVVAKGTFEDARQVLRSQHFDVLITDVRLGAFNGLQLAVHRAGHDTRDQVDRVLGIR